MSTNYYNEFGININNDEMFFHKNSDSELDSKMIAIRIFTSSSYFLKLLYKVKGFKIIKCDKNKLELNYKKETIEFSRLSDLILCSTEEKTIETKKELLNLKQRKGKCHYKSFQFVHIGDNLVTGYVDDSIKNRRIIHTWLESLDTVIDYTANVIMKKEDYYKLMNVEVLSVINKEDVYNDCNSNFIKEFLSAKFYCLFRDELNREGLIEFYQDKNSKKIKKFLI